jgi:hypothetical protein
MTTERHYESSERTLHIAEFESNALRECVVGTFDGDGVMHFRPSAKQRTGLPYLMDQTMTLPQPCPFLQPGQ